MQKYFIKSLQSVRMSHCSPSESWKNWSNSESFGLYLSLSVSSVSRLPNQHTNMHIRAAHRAQARIHEYMHARDGHPDSRYDEVAVADAAFARFDVGRFHSLPLLFLSLYISIWHHSRNVEKRKASDGRKPNGMSIIGGSLLRYTVHSESVCLCSSLLST